MTIGYFLSKSRIKIIILEKESSPGGLINTFNYKNSKIEKFYHYIFTSDREIQSLLNELDLTKKLTFIKSKNAIYVKNGLYPCNSFKDFLNFPLIDFPSKIRSLFGLALVYLLPWSFFKNKTIEKTLPKLIGQNTYNIIWHPLLKKKFHQKGQNISLTWFWSRLRARTAKLGYIIGSFNLLTKKLCQEIEKNGGQILTNEKVVEIKRENSHFFIQTNECQYQSKCLISTLAPA